LVSDQYASNQPPLIILRVIESSGVNQLDAVPALLVGVLRWTDQLRILRKLMIQRSNRLDEAIPMRIVFFEVSFSLIRRSIAASQGALRGVHSLALPRHVTSR
jgi:hypothetical protein